MKLNRDRSPRLRAALATLVLFALAGCNPLSCLFDAFEPGWLKEIRKVHLPADPVVQERVGESFSVVGTSVRVSSGERTKNADNVLIDVAPSTTHVTLKLEGQKGAAEVVVTVRDPEWSDETMTLTAMSLRIVGQDPIDLTVPVLKDTDPMVKDAVRGSQKKADVEIAALAELDSDVAARLGTPLVHGDRLNNSFHPPDSSSEQREPVRLKVRGPKGAGIVRAEVVTPAGKGQTSRVTNIAFETTL